MVERVRRASKRKIPKEPGKTKCEFTFEVDGEIVIMKVDCSRACLGKEMKKDVCWSNLVKAISSSALPDRIILNGKRTVICDRILVSLIRNAALLVRRVETRLDELKRTDKFESSEETRRLKDLVRAMLYDIPQLISRDFSNGNRSHQKNDVSEHVDDASLAGDILSKKNSADFSTLNANSAEKVSG